MTDAENTTEVSVTLTSKDGQNFKVKKQVILMSGLIKDMLEGTLCQTIVITNIYV